MMTILKSASASNINFSSQQANEKTLQSTKASNYPLNSYNDFPLNNPIEISISNLFDNSQNLLHEDYVFLRSELTPALARVDVIKTQLHKKNKKMPKKALIQYLFTIINSIGYYQEDFFNNVFDNWKGLDTLDIPKYIYILHYLALIENWLPPINEKISLYQQNELKNNPYSKEEAYHLIKLYRQKVNNLLLLLNISPRQLEKAISSFKCWASQHSDRFDLCDSNLELKSFSQNILHKYSRIILSYHIRYVIKPLPLYVKEYPPIIILSIYYIPQYMEKIMDTIHYYNKKNKGHIEDSMLEYLKILTQLSTNKESLKQIEQYHVKLIKEKVIINNLLFIKNKCKCENNNKIMIFKEAVCYLKDMQVIFLKKEKFFCNIQKRNINIIANIEDEFYKLSFNMPIIEKAINIKENIENFIIKEHTLNITKKTQKYENSYFCSKLNKEINLSDNLLQKIHSMLSSQLLNEPLDNLNISNKVNQETLIHQIKRELYIFLNSKNYEKSSLYTMSSYKELPEKKTKRDKDIDGKFISRKPYENEHLIHLFYSAISYGVQDCIKKKLNTIEENNSKYIFSDDNENQTYSLEKSPCYIKEQLVASNIGKTLMESIIESFVSIEIFEDLEI